MSVISMALSFASAIAAFAAAVLWYRASTVQVPQLDHTEPDGIAPAAIDVDGSDFVASAIAQARWNTRGAVAAAIAALLQGIVLLLASIVAT